MRVAGVDYLKYDNCNAKREDWVIDRYAAMRDALNATGRPILYSLCNWGVMEPWLWGPEVSASYCTRPWGLVSIPGLIFLPACQAGRPC